MKQLTASFAALAGSLFLLLGCSLGHDLAAALENPAESATSFGSAQGVNVLAYGAMGNGRTDDTRAIQAAIDATPDGGSILFPPGTYSISAPLNPGDKSVTLLGSGWVNRVVAPFGDRQWQPANSGITGTVIFGASPADAIDFAPVRWHRLVLRDIFLLGSGYGSSVGISYTHSAHNELQNVGVANFGVGVKLNNTFDSTFGTLRIRGCTVGITTSTTNSNQIVFSNYAIEACSTAVNWANGGDTIEFENGLVQSNYVAGIVTVDCNVCTIQGTHFENVGLRAPAIQMLTTGSACCNLLIGNRFSGPGRGVPDIAIRGGTRNVLINNRAMSGGISIDPNAHSTVLIANTTSTLVNNSTDTHIWP